MKFPDFIKVYGDQSYRGDCYQEDAELATAINQIRKRYPDTIGLLVFHTKNEGKKTYGQNNADKMKGQTKGSPDIVIPAYRTFCCEVKRKNHTKSVWQPGQLEYLEAAKKAGAFVCVALGWEAVIQAVEDWQKETPQ